MKKFRGVFAAAILALTLSISAFAGEISIPGIKNTPHPPVLSVTGDILCSDAASTGDISGSCGVITLDTVTEITLSLFQSLLLLF